MNFLRSVQKKISKTPRREQEKYLLGLLVIVLINIYVFMAYSTSTCTITSRLHKVDYHADIPRIQWITFEGDEGQSYYCRTYLKNENIQEYYTKLASLEQTQSKVTLVIRKRKSALAYLYFGNSANVVCIYDHSENYIPKKEYDLYRRILIVVLMAFNLLALFIYGLIFLL